jgi:hypothetical protein
LTRKPSEDSAIEQQLLQLIKDENPQTVRDLVNLATTRLSLSDKRALEKIQQLINQEKIKLKTPSEPIPQNMHDYVLSGKAYWFWATILLSFATTIAVFAIAEDAYPTVYLRYVLGSAFVLYLPGYAFIKALFPNQVPIKTSSDNLDFIERVALSAGMSLALVPIVGLLLNYTPWGIRLTPIVISLLTLTITFATAALCREYQSRQTSVH